jgi:serine/threonine-protein kinase
MGEVYLAEDTHLRRKIALKVLPETIARDKDRLRRFELEAFAASALNHPNILTVYEFGVEQATHFLAAEFVSGETLRQRLARDKVTIAEALDITIQIVSALHAAHGAKIIHRDIKPENVMLREDGYVKVLDFGLAKLSEATALASGIDAGPEAQTRIREQTQAGMILGTVAYMSPEQTHGKMVDTRTDIFSVGVVLYELLTRQQPFTGPTAHHIIVAILEKQPPSLSQFVGNVPDELERIINKAMAKNVTERYQNATQLLTDLKTLQKRLEFNAELERSSSAENTTQIIQTANGKTETPNSIAVMPFANVSADPDNEYFCCGLVEELKSTLSQINVLRVAGYSSPPSLSEKEADIREIGRKLGVATVLEGSVRKVGNRLRISVQLVKVSDGYHLWSEQYNREHDDILTIQEEIANEISRKLQVELTGKEKARLAKRPTENPVAYRHYLKGRYHLNQFTEEGFRRAVEEFRLAVAEEPGYSQAYSGLADSYIELAFFSYVAPHEAYPKAKAAAQKALAIDSSLAEAHWSMAAYNFYYEWDWESAERRYKTALELAQRDPAALRNYGFFLAAMGRYDDALEQLELAQELDPLSPVSATTSAIVLFHARRAEDGIATCRKVLELDPGYPLARWVLAWNLQLAGLYEQATIEAKHACDASGEDPQFLAVLGHSYGRNGQRGEANKVLQQLFERRQQSHISPFLLALVYAGLGAKDETFKYLEEAFQQRTGWLVWLRSYPPFDLICEDVRYRDLLQRVGLQW